MWGLTRESDKVSSVETFSKEELREFVEASPKAGEVAAVCNSFKRGGRISPTNLYYVSWTSDLLMIPKFTNVRINLNYEKRIKKWYI